MRIDIVSIFPNVFFGPFSESIVKRAIENGLVSINTVNLRDFTEDKRRTVDDKPYGGGPGMLMKPEPFFKAVEKLKTEDSIVLMTSPQGELFNQKNAEELSRKKHIIILSGNYEGVDERVPEALADKVFSIGDYVLSNGEIAAMVIVDAIIRLIPGALGSELSSREESHAEFLLEYPQYTRPENFRGMKVPEVLLSGNHGEIKKWRLQKSIELTKRRRPDLYEKFLNKHNQGGYNEYNGQN